MNAARIAQVMRMYPGATSDDAELYVNLRDEGHSLHAAAVMASLADPYINESDEVVQS